MIVSMQVLMPCMDGFCEQNNKGEVEFSVDGGADYQEMGHEDHCSPFCTCVCCHSNYVSSENFKEPKPKSHIDQEAKPLNGLVPSFLDRIWQPPKV